MAGNFIQIDVTVKDSEKGANGVKIRKIQESKPKQPNTTAQEKVEKIKNALDIEGQLMKRAEGAAEKKQAGKAYAYMAASMSIDLVAAGIDLGLSAAQANVANKAMAGGNSGKANAQNNNLTAFKEGAGLVIATGAGALSGLGAAAGIGALIGSSVGPVGTAVGIIVGALIGLIISLGNIIIGNKQEKSQIYNQLITETNEAIRKANRLGVITSNRGRTNANAYML